MNISPPNLFIDLATLGKLGKDSIVGRTVRIRKPASVLIGDHCIIDDFTYISSSLTTGDYCHIGANGVVTGGKAHVKLGHFVNIAPGCRLIGVSNDFSGGGLVGAAIPEEFAGETVSGDITLADHVLLGAGTIVLGPVVLPEGVSTGAMTLVTSKTKLEPWTLYAGVPARPLKKRNAEQILAASRRLRLSAAPRE